MWVVLDVAVLGSVKVSSRGREHPLGGAKQQGLLARLVISRGRPLSAEHLIDDLWDTVPPRDPVHALQARISRLRSSVPLDIEWLDGGYRVDPTAVRTDAARFEQLCQQGEAAISDGDLALAAQHLGDALDLWRGQAYAGLLDINALRAESSRLENLWSAALANRIDLDLALGRSAAVISELHALVEEHPFAERHWSQLMTALYCEGRHNDALAAFARARALFAEHLGVEPSSELGRLHTGILRGQSPESLLRLQTTAAERESGTLREDLPRRLTSNQPGVLAALLREKGALLLTGPIGIGKTHLLRAIRTRFEAQRCTVSLLTASPLSQAIPLGVFIGILPEKWTSPAALVDHFTRHRSTAMLLVDNVQQLDQASLFVISQLIHNSRVPTILTATDIADAPEEIRDLYDSGAVTEITVHPLDPSEADDLVAHTIGGSLTPRARHRVFTTGQGVPLHLREILTGSVDEGRLVNTEHGWELHGDPTSTTRLRQLVGERFADLDDTGLDAAAKIAIAGEYPASALESSERRILVRTGVVEYSDPGWLRLSHPLDGEFLRDRCSDALWQDLSRDVLTVLSDDDLVPDHPAARRRAQILALDLGESIDPDSALHLAQHALGARDERLALRAATAVLALDPEHASAHRIAGLAASALGRSGEAERHFESAIRVAATSSERTAAALAYAQHLGMRQYDARAALAVIEQTIPAVDDLIEISHLQRDAIRWSTIAGQVRDIADAPGDTSSAVAVLSLITAAMSGVITGPLDDAVNVLSRLHRAPAEILALVPGSQVLIELTAIMALSNTGDVTAAQRRLRAAIDAAQQHAPESLGAWEYALGFSELLSGDVEHAFDIATAAVAHLEWRDPTGLLPAALALVGAAACVTGRDAESGCRFEAIPAAAAADPKVVMLRAWAQSWREQAAGRSQAAARHLIDSAREVLRAQHTYLAAMLAHCAVRVVGVVRDAEPDRAERAELRAEAESLLDEARVIAGGGLLDFFVRHAAAAASGDSAALGAVANDAETLGMRSSAADTRRMLRQHRRDTSPPTMALWSAAAT